MSVGKKAHVSCAVCWTFCFHGGLRYVLKLVEPGSRSVPLLSLFLPQTPTQESLHSVQLHLHGYCGSGSMAQKNFSFLLKVSLHVQKGNWGSEKPATFAPLVSTKTTQRKASCESWAGVLAF